MKTLHSERERERERGGERERETETERERQRERERERGREGGRAIVISTKSFTQVHNYIVHSELNQHIAARGHNMHYTPALIFDLLGQIAPDQCCIPFHMYDKI